MNFRKKGSQYSGNTTGDDEFNTSSNELDNSKSDRQQQNLQSYNEESEDENSIDFRCVVCEKQFQDLKT